VRESDRHRESRGGRDAIRICEGRWLQARQTTE